MVFFVCATLPFPERQNRTFKSQYILFFALLARTLARPKRHDQAKLATKTHDIHDVLVFLHVFDRKRP
jgi:hypothetical protein